MSDGGSPSKQEARPLRMADVRALARIAIQFDLFEVEFSRDGERIVVRRAPAGGGRPGSAGSGDGHAPRGAGEAGGRSGGRGEPSAEGGAPATPASETITSPFVGTFYRAPAPGASPFVVEGQEVKKGDVLCIVEAMKLMNEIEAETDCRILEILASNAQAVEFGQPLFRVVPL